jgi:hypothetical protein
MVQTHIDKIVINAISADHFVIKAEPLIPHVCLQDQCHSSLQDDEIVAEIFSFLFIWKLSILIKTIRKVALVFSVPCNWKHCTKLRVPI